MTLGALGMDREPKRVSIDVVGERALVGERGHGHGGYPGQGTVQSVLLAFQNVPLQLDQVQCLPGRYQLLLEPGDLLLQLLQAPLTEVPKPETTGMRMPQGKTGPPHRTQRAGWLPATLSKPREPQRSPGSPWRLQSQ